MSVVIETTIGDITVDLFCDKRPRTCLNFLKLCKIKYYNLCLFHKIEKHFIAQTGDPTGTGRGGESLFCHLYGEQAKYFDAENKPRLKHEKQGTLSMVNSGDSMNGSQFFLTLADNLTYLDENHSVFGQVVEGFDVLAKLNDAICDNNNRPYQDIRITHTVVLHDPYDDPSGLEVPDKSPEPSKEMLESGYIRADEDIDDSKGKTAEEIEEKLKDSEAKARATILEMVGDIPDADVKPPENVLFVCKLNPVTTSEDLEVIFSRFGPIVSCEVIKDKKSGESLQYAFIEFEEEQHCENAYFKMDNVLIDDRRIHVDFSQSVSKMNWNSRGGGVKDSGRRQDIVIKDKSRQTDGYDLIFDMDGAEESSGRKSKSSSDKYKSSSKRKSSYGRDERDSPPYSEDRKRNAGRKDYAYGDKGHKSSKSNRYSEKGDRQKDGYKNYESTKYDKYYSEKEESNRYNDKYTKNDKYSEREERYKYNDKYDRHSEKEERHKYSDRNSKYDKYSEREEKRGYSEKSDKKQKYDKEERSETRERDDRDSRSRSPEYVPKKHKSSKKKAHHRSVSPDGKKKSRHRY